MEYDNYMVKNSTQEVFLYLKGKLIETTTISRLLSNAGYKYIGIV